MAIEPINIKIEVSGDGTGESTTKKPLQKQEAMPQGENPITTVNISSIFNAIPYGSTVSQGLSTAKGIFNTFTGTKFGMAIGALTVLKTAHEITKNYVWDKRRAEEMQRRAGLRRRGE